MRRSISVIATFFFTFCMTAVVQAVPIPNEPQHVKSLDGKWRFKLEQAGDTREKGNIGGRPIPIVRPEKPIPFEKVDFTEDGTWKEITVPGNWEMEGFSPATYNQPDNAIGLYRLNFDVPVEWRGRAVKINFDGVQNGAEIFVNGQPVNVDEPAWGRLNYHEGGYDAFQADITTGTKFGQKNLIAIRVTKNTPSVDIDSGDYFLLGGIHRPVTLFSVPQVHLDDCKVETKLLPASEAEVRVILALNTPAQGARASMLLQDHQTVEGAFDAQGRAELVQRVKNPRLWNAEKPNLYKLRVDLKDATGATTEQLTQAIGIREISIRNGVLLVNNVPVKLTGMCRHDLDPTLGSAINEEAWRKDILMMKAANVNAIRTSHYPYGSRFYGLCDELGMYVADETAGCWFPTDDMNLAPAFAQRARQTVRRDKNHPSIIIWAIGNENKRGSLNRIAAEEIAKLDKTRPRLVSWRQADHGGVELDDLHYTPPAKIAATRRDPRRAQFPITYLENPNNWDIRNGADFGCTDKWAAILDRTWAEVWDADGIPGSFLWEWAERAVADKAPTKLYDYYPETGINLAKTKGLCDAYRNPRPWFYHVKMVYSPIKVDPKIEVDGSRVRLHAKNYYSFTDLKEVQTSWHLSKDGKPLTSGSTTLSLAPRTSGSLELSLEDAPVAEADSLRLEFNGADGTNIVTYQFPLKEKKAVAKAAALPPDLKFPRFNLTSVTTVRNRIGWRTTIRQPSMLRNIRVQKAGGTEWSPVADEAALRAIPLQSVGKMDADIYFAAESAESDETSTSPLADTSLQSVRTMEEELFFTNQPQPQASGKVFAALVNGKFFYRVSWTDRKCDIQELGWIFDMPAATDRFSWDRKGYWSWYPQTHIGRVTGTATPEAVKGMHVSLTPREDAFDFNSTKYDCNWASLTDAAGKGLRVAFDPAAPHHCRAGYLADGSKMLVVNRQCSPPRDLSSNIVPDFYLTLDRDSEVTGDFTLGGAVK